MIGWTIFLIVLWLIWFWAVRRWVFPKNKTETDLLVQAFNEVHARNPGMMNSLPKPNEGVRSLKNDYP